VPFQVAIGVIDVKTNEVESAGFVADRIRRGLEFIAPERLIITPDCGLVRLPRDVAFGKLTAMAEGTRAVRKELGR
jgi:5-methyltetrahydropteroyltriglutamate--homocysteine methyltransferase